MLEFLNAKNCVQVQDFGGTQCLRKFLSGFTKQRRFSEIVKRIGVVRDTETDFDAAFASVRSSLKNAELPVPESHGEFTNLPLSVGTLILPGQNQNGMLETLLCKTITDNEVSQCIDRFFECIRDEAKIDVTRMEKARAHVFIATKPQPHVSVGVAAKNGYWDLNHVQFEDVRNFLRELVKLRN